MGSSQEKVPRPRDTCEASEDPHVDLEAQPCDVGNTHADLGLTAAGIPSCQQLS